MLEFVTWCNNDHKHSGLKFLSPAERHTGQCQTIMDQRKSAYEAAKQRNPHRWSGNTRNRDLPEKAWLNPVSELEEVLSK